MNTSRLMEITEHKTNAIGVKIGRPRTYDIPATYKRNRCSPSYLRFDLIFVFVSLL
jgi:hypothetical protein